MMWQRSMFAPAATSRGPRSISAESSVETNRTLAVVADRALRARRGRCLCPPLRAGEQLERGLLPERLLEPLDRPHGDLRGGYREQAGDV